MRSVSKLFWGGVLILGAGAMFFGTWEMSHPAGPGRRQELPAAAVQTGSLQAVFFGTTTLLFRDQSHAVMVDAFLSRPDLQAVLTKKIATDPVRVAQSLLLAGVSHIDLLLISHSHFDHVFDAPLVAMKTGALLVGSPSTYEVGLGGGVPPEKIRTVLGGEQLDAGRFHVTVIRSLHSPDDKVPGDISSPLHQPASIKSYRQGGTFSYLIEHAGLHILVHPSANFVPGMYRGVHADIVFLSIGGLGRQSRAFSDAYWREVVEATGAKLVVPIHWDDFTQPLDRPLQPMRRFIDDFSMSSQFIDPLAQRDCVAIRYMQPLVPVDLTASASQRGCEDNNR